MKAPERERQRRKENYERGMGWERGGKRGASTSSLLLSSGHLLVSCWLASCARVAFYASAPLNNLEFVPR